MTPLYDVLSAQKAVDDGQIRQNRTRFAMSVDGHYRIIMNRPGFTGDCLVLLKRLYRMRSCLHSIPPLPQLV